MRLINAETGELENFFQGQVPAYAILSHTWGPDAEEISYQDFQVSNVNKPGIGRFKLDASCKQTLRDGLKYIWNDTCCIDKTSSTELSEAINSMFQWYSNAAKCYAYLQDVPCEEGCGLSAPLFVKSRWFLRGWTLQELLAPQVLHFFSTEWRPLGSRRRLATLVEQATGIPRPFLIGIADISEASVAQRMSWAANRMTKRREDIAYSLLGIFGVAMPMIYGEGDRAFIRLQEEIMRRSTDDSILAWGLEEQGGLMSTDDATSVPRGVLALRPADFAQCGFIVSGEHSTTSIESSNALGGSLRVRLPLYTAPSGDVFGLLGSHLSNDHAHIVGIPLRISGSSNTYVRAQNIPSKIFQKDACEGVTTSIHIRKEQDQVQSAAAAQRRHSLFSEDKSDNGLEVVEVYPRHRCQKDLVSVAVIRRRANHRPNGHGFVSRPETSLFFMT